MNRTSSLALGVVAVMAASAPAAAAPPVASVEAGPLLVRRQLAFVDGTGPLRDHDLGAAFGVGVGAEAWPLAAGPLRLGLAFGYASSAGVYSDTDRGKAIPSTWTRLEGGLGARLAFGEATVALLLGAHREAFTFADPDERLPAARYLGMRAALVGRVPLGPVVVHASAAALPVTSLAGIAEAWNERSAFGLEGALGLGVRLGPSLEARLLAAHTRYAAHYASSRGTAGGDASGATDAYSRLQVSLVFSP